MYGSRNTLTHCAATGSTLWVIIKSNLEKTDVWLGSLLTPISRKYKSPLRGYNVVSNELVTTLLGCPVL